METATKMIMIPIDNVDDNEVSNNDSDDGLQNLYESEFWLLLGSL